MAEKEDGEKKKTVSAFFDNNSFDKGKGPFNLEGN